MPTDSRNVSLPMPMPTRKELRKALADIVRSVQAENALTDEEIAHALGISESTVRNVRNERTDLNQQTIAMIGRLYGPEALDPWSACFGGRNVPREASEERVSLTAITGGLHKLSRATDPDSDGGEAITHRELADMLPDLRAMQRLVNSLIARSEKLGLVA